MASKKFKKAVTFCYSKSKDCVQIIFQSAANNHIRLQKERGGKFRSYVQLKRYQKHLRFLAVKVIVAAVFLFIGILIGPAIFDDEHDIYIPNGKGDILISNVSKDEATIVFKTFDLANDNRPFATVASVSVYSDPQHKNLIKKTAYSDYAVTHIIPISGLEEGNTYYLEIMAAESKQKEGYKTVSTWGSGIEPIKFYATGDLVPPVCQIATTAPKIGDENNIKDKSVTIGIPTTHSYDSEEVSNKKGEFSISAIQSENYLYGKDKVQTIISWKTNDLAYSSVVYREKDAKEERLDIKGRKGRSHMAVMTSFKPETTYYFRIEVEKEDGEKAVSDEYSLRTPHSRETIFDIVADNFNVLINEMGF